MTRKFQSLLLGITCLALLALVTHASAANRLSGAQIKAFFKGTFVGEYGKKKTPFVVHVSATGKLQGEAEGKYDKGRWRVKGNKLCISWKHWSSDKEKCRHVVRLGGWYAALKSSGKIKLRLRRK